MSVQSAAVPLDNALYRVGNSVALLNSLHSQVEQPQVRWLFRIFGRQKRKPAAEGKDEWSVFTGSRLAGKFSCRRDATLLRHLIRHRLRWVCGPLLTLFQVSATSEHT